MEQITSWANKGHDEHVADETSSLLTRENEGDVVQPADQYVPFLKSRTFGIILISLSATSYGLSATVVSIEKDIATPLIVGARFFGAFLLTAIACLYNKVDVRISRENRGVLITRSVFGVVSFVCGTYAFQNMPVGEATVLISMAPVFVAIFSACFLGEVISCWVIFLIILSISGIIMIVDPDALAQQLLSDSTAGSFYKLNLIAACAAIGQAVSKAVSYIFIKRSNGRIYFLAMIFWYALFGTLITLLFTLITYFSLKSAGKDTSWLLNPLDSNDYFFLTTISILGFISQITLTKSTQMLNTTIVSLIRNGDIIVTMLFQIFYFKIVPCWIQVLGIVVMVVSTLLILVSKERDRVMAAHPRCFRSC